MKNFPIDTHCKKSPASCKDMIFTKAGNFYNGGLCGNSLPVVGLMKFCPTVFLKPSNNRGEFKLD